VLFENLPHLLDCSVRVILCEAFSARNAKLMP
jgi:hypothetical protein